MCQWASCGFAQHSGELVWPRLQVMSSMMRFVPSSQGRRIPSNTGAVSTVSRPNSHTLTVFPTSVSSYLTASTARTGALTSSSPIGAISGHAAAASRTSSLPVTTSAIRRVRYSRSKSICCRDRSILDPTCPFSVSRACAISCCSLLGGTGTSTWQKFSKFRSCPSRIKLAVD